MKTDLSIIIVSYKGWDRLTKCLESLEKFTGNNFTAQVVVVDNKSEDQAIRKFEARFNKFRFIYNTVNGGFGNGCNLGARNAAGEYLLFLNPDTIASENEIGKLLDTARQNPGYSVVSCRQVDNNGKESSAYGSFPSASNLTGLQRAILKSRTPHTAHRTPDIIFPDWISGSVVMIRNELFRSIKGFDEDFWMYYEDVDLCKRIRDSGGEIAFLRNATIEHNHGGSSRINLKTTSLTKTEVFISRHLYISKHLSGSKQILVQVFLVINNFISGGLMAIVGLLLFFVPRMFSRTLIFSRLISYYFRSFFRLSWISPRSVNFRKS
jgi:GT2 family glycosyltransferase